MANKSVNVTVGPGFAGGLTILFVALKLLGHIDWSWWWVLSPLWIVFAVVAVILVFCVILGALVE